MKYLKLYEDFNSKTLEIKSLMKDIASLDYILSDEGVKAKYYLTEKMASGSTNRYQIGTSGDISHKIDDSFEGVGIYKIQIYFEIELDKEYREEISEEYYNKLKEQLEDAYGVSILKDTPYMTGKIKHSGGYEMVEANCVSVIVERQPDDYVYFDDEDIEE